MDNDEEMPWSFWVHNTLTGARVEQVYPAGGEWTRRLGALGEGSHTFQLRDPEYGETARERRAYWRSIFRPVEHMLAVAWEGQCIYQGVLGSPGYDMRSGVLTLPHKELRAAMWDNRHVGADTINGRSLTGAVRAALGRAVVGGGPRALPLDGPPDGAGDFTKIILGTDAMTVEDLIGLIEKLGCEVDHPPYFTSGYAARWGTTVAAQNIGATVDLPISASGSLVTALSTVEDVAKLVTYVEAVGNGVEAEMLMAIASNNGPVALERVLSSTKDVTDLTQLQNAADEEMRRYGKTLTQWSLEMTVDEDITPLDLVPGTLLRADVRDDDWNDDGVTTARVISLGGDMSRTLKPEVQIWP